MTPDRPPHRFTLRVYYEDTDFSGVVYHAGYLRFLERGRTELLRDLGIVQADLFAGRFGAPLAFAVTSMRINFRRPARMDDALVVETRRLKRGGASLLLGQSVWRGDDQLVEAEVKVAALTPAGRVARLPPDLLMRLDAD